jgi:pimeloyl-ACP methyl ester carboxylesterase
VERTVQTPDGRTLAVQEAGDREGRAVLVHMGSPNSRHLYGPNAADAAARGLRLICYDRPGYGGSTPQPGRTHADCAADVRAICAALGIDRVAIWGMSGGSAHALACAALLPDLVVAAAALAGLAPYGADGLDWFDGMGKGNADGFRLLLADKVAGRTMMEKLREQLLAATADDQAKALESLLSPVDAAVLASAMAEYLALAAHDGLAPGSEGWFEDANAQAGVWGFEPADISVPVMIMHGRQDRFVPVAHGEWLAAHVPGVEARILDGDGHLTLLEHRIPEVHSWLSGWLAA